MSSILYFAYGSNMCSRRLRARVSSATPVGAAVLTGHRVQFHKRGMDGSAKADCEFTGHAHDLVWGVVYRLSDSDKPTLDRYEDLGTGYAEKHVEIRLGDSSERASTYAAMAQAIQRDLKPFHWYLAHVVRGAREHGLPDDYIASLARFSASADPDRARRSRETSIAE